jgi:hypothetical protein
MSDAEYEAYQRHHDYDFPLDEEAAKIARETADYDQRRRRQTARLKRELRQTAGRLGEVADLLGELEDLPDQEDLSLKRERGNARTHKRRRQQMARRTES